MEDNATLRKIKLKDGRELPLSLSFLRLLKLRQSRPDKYKIYNNIFMDGFKDEVDFVNYIYVAYLCAIIDDLDNAMGFNDFLALLPEDHTLITATVAKLQRGDAGKN